MSFFKSQDSRVNRNYNIDQSGVAIDAPPLRPLDEKEASKICWTPEFIQNIIALFSSIIFSSIGYGILTVLIAFKVESNVKNEILISISSACQIAAGVFFARFLPSFGRKFGMINSIHIASCVSALCGLLLFFYIDYFLWIIVIFILGISFFISGVTRQTLMIDLAPASAKAIVISLGGMLVAIGNSLGPIVINLLKTGNSFFSFLLVAVFYLTSLLPLSRLKKIATEVKGEKKIGIFRYIKNSPKIMFAGFSVNYALSAANAFLIIYGIKIGIASSEAALLYSVLLFGTIFSIPIGYLTDHINRRFLMIFSAFLALICVFLLYFNQNHDNIYLLLFLTFGCMTGIKLPAIVLINEKYKPTQRLAVNAAFAKFSLMGNITGIFITGAIMKIAGPSGLWLSLIIILSLFIIFCTYNYMAKFLRGGFKDGFVA